MQRVLIYVAVALTLAIVALYIFAGAAMHPVQVPSGSIAEAATQPKCGNVSVVVHAGESAQLCPGVTVSADTPTATTGQLMPQLAPTTSTLTFESCTWRGGWAFSGSSSPNVVVTASEIYWLQPFSNIDPGFQNPPSFSMSIDALTQSLGYHDGGTSEAMTQPSAYFSPNIIAQIWVHGVQELDWFVPPLVVRDAILNAHADSPGFTSNGCNYSNPDAYSWTYTESDVISGTGSAVSDFVLNFPSWVWGLCGLFNGC